MRLGVICEGPSDYPAMVHFVGAALKNQGIDAVFQSLSPNMDKTRPEGGWGSVLTWLNNNPPVTRIQRYFGGGLFGGELQQELLDAIIIQLDTDIIVNSSFTDFVRSQYGLNIKDHVDPELRAREIVQVITKAANLDILTDADARRHVPFAAVESTETWCIAAFNPQKSGSELLKGLSLTNAFMTALEKSESKSPKLSYQNIDKTYKRREIFCKKHASNVQRILDDCGEFCRAVGCLVDAIT